MKERRQQPNWQSRSYRDKYCLCGCGEQTKGKAYYASAACRKRRQRQIEKEPSQFAAENCDK